MTLTIELSPTLPEAGYQMKSPDVLVPRIRFDTDPPPDESVLALLKGEPSLRDLLAGAARRNDLPLGGIKAGKNTVTVIPLADVLAPALNPFLVQDNLSAARSLHADCLELRRRIEALQLDLFNFMQEAYEQEQETALHDTIRKRMADDVETRRRLLTAKQEEVKRYQQLQEAWVRTVTNYGPTASGYSDVGRVADHLRQQFWSVVYTASAGGTAPSLVKSGNADTPSMQDAGLPDASPAKAIFSAMKRDAQRSVAFDSTSLQNEVIRTELGLSALVSQEAELASALGHAEDDLFLADERWKTRTELWRRRRAQFDDEHGLSLRRRLADSLTLYAQLSGQLRQVLHAIEFGQAVVYGLKVPGFEPESLTVRNRYLFAPHVDDGAPFSGDAVWATLDYLASLLFSAEQRHRKTVQEQEVWHSCETFEGTFEDGKPLTFERVYDESTPLDPLKPPPPRRIVALRLVNMGDPVSFSATLEPSGFYGGPIGGATFDIVKQYPASLRYEVVPTSNGGTPAEIPLGEAQFLNRELKGTLKVTASGRQTGAARVSMRLDIWHTT